MSDDVLDGTLGPLLGVEGWLQSLRGKDQPNYYAQTGQYAEEDSHLLKCIRDTSFTAYCGAFKTSQNSPLKQPSIGPPTTEDMGLIASNACKETENDESDDPETSAVTAVSETSTTSRCSDTISPKPVQKENGVCTGHPRRRGRPPSSSRVEPPEPAKKRRIPKASSPGPPNVLDATTFAKKFFGLADEMHINYHWNKLDLDVLESARHRGLEPTTLGHVLRKRKKLWAQIQCIHKSAKAHFEKHMRLYQRQFESYNKSSDGWVNVNVEHKPDPVFLKARTYLTGVQNVTKILTPPSSVATQGSGQKELSDGPTAGRRPGHPKKPAVKGVYNWNNVIYYPNLSDSGEVIHRHARRTLRLYKNLYDCLVHGWVHPGLVVCEVRDVTHPIRFATPTDQDCFTVVYAGPRIPETATQRVVFGEYTGVVYREDSLEDTLFEYAFELNFSPSAWINADFEYYKDSADIEEHDNMVMLPNTSKFVLDSSQACNELSLVNHYQSIKVYGGEKWPVPNCEWQQVFLDGWPHVVLTSKVGVAVNPGDELVADFGALWFSKVEETAHKYIRNEVIGYRLGRVAARATALQLEMPQRPLNKIDVGLKPNTVSTAAAMCAICYKTVEDQSESSTSEETELESESVSCDGCDRFFHIDCIRSMNAASALHLVRDGLRPTWAPSDTYKGIPLGSGKFYCNFCRHLAKKIFMHDAGCDYMPLAHDYKDSLVPQQFVSSYTKMDLTSCFDNKRRNVDGEERQRRLVLSGNVDFTMSRSSAPHFLMRPLNNPTLFDLAKAGQNTPRSENDSGQASRGNGKLGHLGLSPVATTDSADPLSALLSNGTTIVPSSTSSSDDSSQCKRCQLKSMQGAVIDSIETPRTVEVDVLDTLPPNTDNRKVPQSCSYAMDNDKQRASRRGNERQLLRPNSCGIPTVACMVHSRHEKDSRLCNGVIALDNMLAVVSRSATAAKSKTAIISDEGGGNIKGLLECEVNIVKTTSETKDRSPKSSTLPKGSNIPDGDKENKNEAHSDSNSHVEQSVRVEARRKRTSQSKSNDVPLEKVISTANIGRAADFFKAIERRPNSVPIRRLPDRTVTLKLNEDTTLADYLGCKYLAGMWQVEPFALFGDTVRVCTECYKNNGSKANVYVCRILKRHLSGNFDHPMNTTPSQIRELVLMAYDQHVHMLLRLLVLKNIAIKFMCRLCCHFVGRQLFLRKQEGHPPLPFPSSFMGQDSGPPEGLLATPFGLVSSNNGDNTRVLRPQQRKILQSHLSSFVTSVKNAVFSVPVSSKSEPSLSYDLLNAMGAFSDEFSRLAKCDDIVQYLNDLMSHKVLDADNIPGQLQQMLTKDELNRFMVFRHLSERSPSPFGTTHTPTVQVKKRYRGATFMPILGVVPNRTFIYRQFKDGYYKGTVTEYTEDSSSGKVSFLVSYSDGDDEMLSHDELVKEVLDNIQNIENVIENLSPNDMHNEELLIKIHGRGDKLASVSETVRRELVRNLSLHRGSDSGKKGDSPSKNAHVSSSRHEDREGTPKGGDKRRRVSDTGSYAEIKRRGTKAASSSRMKSINDGETTDTDMSS
ncbi:uncharacterized protein BXIN_2020 [Babesia sp. Xinjiang]|uniref:uncharacterized protein n=1 Tax=Babesia sp. Xinjiang TaxID=462227 RepID=UPI000A247504|nr:uncharacterized protein BXIN_2020 [Babesia sp. Xinjiang]ORM40308.1 hypothetical protein BXIN_2020 [Babesia sp. Xinjiang]